MNVFKIHSGWRDIGINHGLPTFYVDCGIGVNYQPVDIARKLLEAGCKKGLWVTLRGNPVGEKGCGLLVGGLKQLGIKVEVEDEGLYGAPGWYPQVDHWIIWWRDKATFNYGALRPRQDILIYQGEGIKDFLDKTNELPILRALIVEDRAKVWELVKDKEVRVYVK